MAHAGQEIEGQAGFRVRLVKTGAETGGELLEMEATYGGTGQMPPEHFHPRQAERFTILAGALRVRLGGVERELRVGDTLDIPAGVPHGMWNGGDAPATARWETRPALGTERLFASLHAFAAAGAVDARGVPALLDLAVLVPRHWGEMRLTRPAPAVQRLVFGLLGPLARALGRGTPPQGAR